MIRKIDSNTMGKGNHGWLNSLFHFSFAEYYNRNNMNFGVLRVLNDDLVSAKSGFDPHPHRDMEIISYIVDGQLTHGDNLGNKKTVSRGDVQYMSAGTGVIHSEYNLGDNNLRFLQMWILPDTKNHVPAYGDYRFNSMERKNQWLQMVSSKLGKAPIKINQDVNLYVTELSELQSIEFVMEKNRQAYLVLIEGNAIINQESLKMRDALEIIDEKIQIESRGASHILIVEMAKSI